MIDLHSHSRASDGSDTPGRLVEIAAETGVGLVALTDHDIVDGLAEALATGERAGVRVVPGCELSCEVTGGTMHLLVYFLDPAGGPLQDQLAALRDARGTRNERIVATLNEHGLDVTLDEVLEEAGGGTVGRPHLAAVLLRKGYVESIQDAFDRWLAKGKPAYVDRDRMTPAVAIEIAHASGAVAVLAHPFSLDRTPGELETFVGELTDLGLDGMEVEYGRYRPDERSALRAMAERHGLALTGGSDYHGTYKPDLRLGVGLGDLAVPDEWVDALEARRPAHS